MCELTNVNSGLIKIGYKNSTNFAPFNFQYVNMPQKCNLRKDQCTEVKINLSNDNRASSSSEMATTISPET